MNEVRLEEEGKGKGEGKDKGLVESVLCLCLCLCRLSVVGCRLSPVLLLPSLPFPPPPFPSPLSTISLFRDFNKINHTTLHGD